MATSRSGSEIDQSPDAVRGILGLPLAADPGSEWAYSSATSHLLSALVADTTGGSTLDFARERLFGPLGIDTSDAYDPERVTGRRPPPELLEQYARARVAWPTDAQGYHFGGAFLKLPGPRPREVRLPVPQRGPLGRRAGHPGRVRPRLDVAR